MQGILKLSKSLSDLELAHMTKNEGHDIVKGHMQFLCQTLDYNQFHKQDMT